jgi:hypothetical protein
MPHVEDLIAELTTDDGYRIVSRGPRLVVLERKNSWIAVAFTAVFSSWGGGYGGAAMQRTERLYLEVDNRGEATLHLAPPLLEEELRRDR